MSAKIIPLHRGTVIHLASARPAPERELATPPAPAPDIYELFAKQRNEPVHWFDRIASAVVWTVIFIGSLTFWIGLLAWLVLS